MSLAPQELENSASRHATDAIKYDSQGARGMAVTSYQKAVDVLLKIMHLYPNCKLSPLYKERISKYQNRVTQLQNSRAVEPAVDPNATAEEQKKALGKQEASNTFDELIMREKPNVKWEEVIGLKDAKDALRESIVYPTRRPDLFPLGWPRGILLFGPPGCGKTILAAATASELDGYFISVDASSIMSKWLGEAEKNVSQLFTMARGLTEREGKPVILFIDEIDSLLGSRNSEIGGEVRTKNQFLTEMDGIGGKGKNIKMYVIGATNKPWSLDDAFLRRFQKRINIPLPSVEDRGKLFELYTAPLKKNPRVSNPMLAKLYETYSASDIKDACQAVQLKVVHEMFSSKEYHEPGSGEDMPNPKEITMADFREVMAQRKPSVSVEMVRAYEKWAEQHGAL